MEIVNPLYYAKLLASFEMIESVAARFRGSAFLSYNGGKDSTVLLELVERSNANLKVVCFREENAFPELQEFILRRLSRTRLDCMILEGEIKGQMDALVKQGYQAVLLGQRLSDPGCPTSAFDRASPSVAKSSPGWPEFLRILPILDWTYADVWRFLRLTNSEVCSLYARGYTSIGSLPGTVPNPLLGGKPAWELNDVASERVGRLTDY